MQKTLARLGLAAAMALPFAGFLPAFALADTTSVNFEPATYTVGTINGQDGWLKTGAYDSAVSASSVAGFGTQSLRISDAVASGSFGDQTFSKPLANEAGETDALNNGISGGVRQNHFEAQFDIASVLSDVQPGMHMSVSPDRGDGARMSYLRFEDQTDGIHVFFDDVQGTVLNGVDGCVSVACGNFVETEIATIDRGPHTIKFVMDFVEGPHNDVVKIYIDGVLKITGTSWEDYYRFDPESNPTLVSNSRTVDSLLFRVSSDADAHPDNLGNGFFIDNLSLASSINAPACIEDATHSVTSDATTYNATDSINAVLLTFIHPEWDANIPDAKWIWATDPVVTVADTDVTKTFTKTFTVVGTPTGGALDIAADNSYSVKVNGTALPVVFDQNNFKLGTQDHYDISSLIVAGANTLEVTATNWGVGQSTDPSANPAGVLYKVTYHANECVTPPPPKGSLTVTKIVVGNDAFHPSDFPLFVDDTSVTSGVAHDFAPGMHVVHETGNPNFMPAFSGDCVLSADSLARLPKIQDFQAKNYALQLAINNSPGDPLNTEREAHIVDNNEKIAALQASLEADVVLGADQSAQCTITNTFVPPPPTKGSLRIVKTTIGGDGTFTFTGVADGASITTVNGTGNATIENLTPGTYSAVETAQAGWNLSANTCTNVQVTAGETTTCTVTNTAQSSISGTKYNDLNRNGKQDPGEPGLSGWVIRLMSGKTVVATAITDAAGNYHFTNIAPGTYKVRETHQNGWKRMSKNPKAIVITAGSVVTDVTFGNAQKKKAEKEDTDNDDNHDDHSGYYYSHHDHSDYGREQDSKGRDH